MTSVKKSKLGSARFTAVNPKVIRFHNRQLCKNSGNLIVRQVAAAHAELMVEGWRTQTPLRCARRRKYHNPTTPFADAGRTAPHLARFAHMKGLRAQSGTGLRYGDEILRYGGRNYVSTMNFLAIWVDPVASERLRWRAAIPPSSVLAPPHLADR